MRQDRPRSSRARHRKFVEDYKAKRLDLLLDAHGRAEQDEPGTDGPAAGDATRDGAGRRPRGRRYLRDFFRGWTPHRPAVLAFIARALARAGLEMIEPLFMRYMVDKVLLNRALDLATRLTRLNLIGTAFLAVVVVSQLVNA